MIQPTEKYISLKLKALFMLLKKILILLILGSFFGINAQNISLKGQVFDSHTHEPLPFAHIYIDDSHGSISNEKGIFNLEVPKETSNFKVAYTGYKSLKIPIKKESFFYKVYLIPNTESLEEIKISAKGINPALVILKKALKRKKQNDYRKQNYPITHTNYYQFKLSIDRDRLNPQIDTIHMYKEGKKTRRIDSTMYQLGKDLEDKEWYMVENITENTWIGNKVYRKVLALKTAGLKNPFYELLQLQFSGKSPYDDYYRINLKEYLGPFSKKSLTKYTYKLVDSLDIQGRPAYRIHFTKKQKPKINGQMLIDAQNYALAGLEIHSQNQLLINTSFEFKYFPEKDLWFPMLQKSMIRAAKDFSKMTMGPVTLIKKIKDPGIDSIKHTNPQKVNDLSYLKITDSVSRINLKASKAKKPVYCLEVLPDAHKKKEDFWMEYTGKRLTEREKNTYKTLDSLFETEKVEEKINRYKNLIYGKYRMGAVDLNFMQLLSYNQYEKLRMEINLQTNRFFSDKWNIHTYLAYGTGDRSFKYHGSLGYKISHRHQTFLRLGYTSDLEKGAAFKNLEDEVSPLNILDCYACEKYTSYKKVSLDLTGMLSQEISYQLGIDRGFYQTKFPFPYHPGRIEFPDYELTQLNLNVKYEPHSEYILTPDGRRKIKNGYPKFLWAVQTNIPAWQTDPSYFLRTEIQSLFRKTYINKDFTDLKIQLGMNFGQVRIQQMFQPDFDDFEGGSYLAHLLSGKKYAFETVKDFEFLNNYIATAHLSHRITHLRIRKNKSIDLGFTTAAAIGYAWDEHLYSGSRDLRKGLFESGVEVFQLIKGFTLGVYYRYGAYARPGFKDNLALRFSFNFEDWLK